MSETFARRFKRELWGCHKHMGLSFTELYNMTVADRKFYIAQHNREVEAEKERMRSKSAIKRR